MENSNYFRFNLNVKLGMILFREKVCYFLRLMEKIEFSSRYWNDSKFFWDIILYIERNKCIIKYIVEIISIKNLNYLEKKNYY